MTRKIISSAILTVLLLFCGSLHPESTYKKNCTDLVEQSATIRRLIKELLKWEKEKPKMATTRVENEKKTKTAYAIHFDFKRAEFKIEGERKDYLTNLFLNRFTSMSPNAEEITRIEIYGHTDLQPYEHNNVKLNKILGKDRRKEAAIALVNFEKEHMHMIPKNISTIIHKLDTTDHGSFRWYHEDFLLHTCNEEMEGRLWPKLEVEKIVAEIIGKLRLKSDQLGDRDYVEEIRRDPDLFDSIKKEIDNFDAKFKKFRCIVIITYTKGTQVKN